MIPRLLTTAFGIWLMAAPDVVGYAGAARINDRLLGPLIAAGAIIAMSQATRPVRWVGVPLGAWLLAAPWLLGYGAAATTLNSLLVGLAVLLLSCVRGRVPDRFGGGWAALWRANSPTETRNRNRTHRPGG